MFAELTTLGNKEFKKKKHFEKFCVSRITCLKHDYKFFFFSFSMVYTTFLYNTILILIYKLWVHPGLGVRGKRDKMDEVRAAGRQGKWRKTAKNVFLCKKCNLRIKEQRRIKKKYILGWGKLRSYLLYCCVVFCSVIGNQ